MKYVTIAELSDVIRRNLWKIPRDIDFVIGVPRSGMIPASIIASFLNVPLIDINSYIAGMPPSGGSRLQYYEANHKTYGRALVVDDTIWKGTAMREAQNKLADIKDMQFVYMCVFMEGRGEHLVDLYLADLRMFTNEYRNIVTYEWNIFQHHEKFMRRCLYDIDGVLCLEPPDERNEKVYLRYIAHATPLFLPRAKIGGIITYRLAKNKEITEKWLRDNGVSYGELIMFDASSWKQRRDAGISPATYKARYYASHDYRLFVETDDCQAQEIARLSGKPVLCVSTNKMY